MVMSCSAYGCTNRFNKDKNVSFYSYPKNPCDLKKWLVAIRRQSFIPGTSAKLCSEHFQPDDFVVIFGKKSLKCNAIPSIFNFPKHLLKEPVKLRSQRLYNQTKAVEEQKTSLPSTSSGGVVKTCQDGTVGNEVGNQCTTDILQETTLESANVSLQSTSPQTKIIRRKRSVPAYVGDTEPADQENPKKRKLMWQIANKTIIKQKKTIKYLQTKLRRSNKKVHTLSGLLRHLKNANKITPECHSILEASLPHAEKNMLLRQLKLSSDRKFPPELRAFALSLHFYSANAYNFVRREFGNCLPHPNTIRKWYSSVDGSPGYTAEAFNALKVKAQEFSSQGKELVCSLMMDEISIREHVDWQGNKNIGYINFGIDFDNDSLPLAKEALVFLLVGVNCQWKIPIAYFLIRSVTASEKANFVKGCCTMIHDAGIKLISLTFDGAATNISMASALGANFSLPTPRTYFPHPVTQEPIFLILDACHMLKLIRNALGDWKTFIDGNGNIINWQFFTKLVDLQEEQDLHLGNKLRRRHVNYSNEKMKVRLAAQIFSSSVGDALEYCLSDLKDPNFFDSEGTIIFCRIIDKMFDLLNTRNSLSKNPYRKALSEKNFNFVKSFFSKSIEYLSSLKNAQGDLMINSRRKTGFIGFIINMYSVQDLIKTYIIEKQNLSYLLTYKLSQDHIETFFCAIRSSGGFNNNPTAAQFESAYKKLLIHAEIKSSSGNCLPQDNTHILHVVSTSKKSVHSLDSIVISDDFEFEELNVNVSETSIQFRNDVVEYIAGFVIRKLRNQLCCEVCSSQLIESESSMFIERKDRGGLIKPSTQQT